MRNLASVRTITSLTTIPGADNIETAQVDGWTCVVKKGEFEVGEQGVFFEIDSFLPAADLRYSFLESKFISWDGKRGCRLRTIRLRKQLSQGLLLPLELFQKELEQLDSTFDPDLTLDQLLGIEKWERIFTNCSLGGQARGNFPSFLRKTDQERIQNLPNLQREYDLETFEVTTKLDGSSTTMYFINSQSEYNDGEASPDGRFGVCSRNIDLVETEGNAFWGIARKLYVELKLSSIPGGSYAIQGELVGPTIQDNHEKVSTNEFYVFDVFNIDSQKYLLPAERRQFCKTLDLPQVPYLDEFTMDIRTTTEFLLAIAEGPGMNLGVKREGLVFKHNKSEFSFKVVSNSYLMAEK